MTQPEKTLYRVRLYYARGEALRYVSHLDTQLVWERTLRRAGIPLAYSQGFNPRPRLHLASALPLGFLSRCEITDLWLELPPGSPAPDPGALAALAQRAAPPGLEITRCELVDLRQPALQTRVQAAEYLAAPLDPVDLENLSHQVEQILSAATLPRERQRSPGKPGKPYDLRPLIEALEVRPAAAMERSSAGTEARLAVPAASSGAEARLAVPGAPGKPALYMRLAAREGATGRPEEVLAALGQEPTDWRVERLNLLLA